jgi:hypothetical protein
VKGQVIRPPFQGDDPAIQQVQRINPLPAEVVDDQGTPVEFWNQVYLDKL